MLLIPKGINGQWIDVVYWTLAAEMAFYGLVFCVMLTKKITLRHLAWALTIYSAVFNAFALLVLSRVIPSEILYLVVLMFRVPCAAWLLSHGCFFALGIWLFISANRKLTALEQVAVTVTCLSGAAEIFYFSSFLLTNIPAISGQSPLVPIIVWAAAVFLIAVAANRSRRSADTASPEAAGYLRTLGLITYPLYLTHNVIGAAIVRVLIHAGLDASLAVWVALSMLVLVCWFICAKIEPAVRRALTQIISYFGSLPKTKPLSAVCVLR
jgi:peptidoglycan/LPS O-acetylase OafA/YrhL